MKFKTKQKYLIKGNKSIGWCELRLDDDSELFLFKINTALSQMAVDCGCDLKSEWCAIRCWYKSFNSTNSILAHIWIHFFYYVNIVSKVNLILKMILFMLDEFMVTLSLSPYITWKVWFISELVAEASKYEPQTIRISAMLIS